MKSAKRAAGLSLALGFLMMGCGGVSAEPLQEAATLQTRADEQPDCSNPDALWTTYYSDDTYSTEIGGRGCSCYTYYSWGKTSVYKQYFTNDSCQ